MLDKFLDWRTEHPWTDWVAASAVVALHAAVAVKFDRGDVLYSMGLERRLDLYGNALTVTGVLVGFTLTTFTFYYSAGGDRMTAVRKRVGAGLTRQWLVALRLPMAALAVFFIIKAVDATAGAGQYGVASNVRWAFELTAVMVALRLQRLFGVFAQIAELRNQDEIQPLKTQRPPMEIPPSPKRVAG